MTRPLVSFARLGSSRRSSWPTFFVGFFPPVHRASLDHAVGVLRRWVVRSSRADQRFLRCSDRANRAPQIILKVDGEERGRRQAADIFEFQRSKQRGRD